jgi:arsenite methyltransferase
MYIDTPPTGFAAARSSTYQEALARYPRAWRADIASMERLLRPSPGETILEIGAGCAAFSHAIAARLGPDGLLFACDPSAEQLAALGAADMPPNIRTVHAAAENLALEGVAFDAIWSRGAVHHIANKTAAFRRIAQLARPRARLVIADIFAGSPVARYFDSFIARACSTGHEATFLSHEFAESLCALTGWRRPVFHDVVTPWRFAEMDDIGRFLHLLFSGRDDCTPQDFLDAAEQFLNITPSRSGWSLMWPMTVMVAIRDAA